MELNSLSIIESIKGLKDKKFTCSDLLTACFKRIAEVDGKIHSFLELNKAESLRQAKRIDSVPVSLPLHGIPIAIKDNFNTANFETTASSNILKGYIPPYDATVVKKLKEAGAIIIGKTNMDSFAHGSSTESSDFGPTLNPWDTSRLPGGSSGGSAAAIAANETIGAIGSETAGSIRGPASWCGCVGLKPTYGRVSRYGLIAMASSTDSPGPITKTVADAHLIYNCLKGFDPNDATSHHEVKGGEKTKPINKITIGLPKEYFSSDSQKGINECVMIAAKTMEKLGAKLVEISLFDPKYAVSVYTIIQRSEVSSNLAHFDGIRFGHGRDKFNDENIRRIMLGTYTLSAGYYEAYYKKAQQVRTLIVEDFERAFRGVDVVLGPTLPSVAPKRGVTKGQSMYGELADVLTEPSSIAGLPGISVPCGFVENLPVGMQIIGPQWSEELIISLARDYEEATDWHLRKPVV